MSLVAPLDGLAVDGALSVSRPHLRHLPKRWMSWCTGLFLSASAAGAWFHRALLGEAWREARRISPAWWLVLASLVVAHRVAVVVQQWSALPGSSFFRMAAATEANLGASNAMVGGSAIGTGLRVAMWRSWGADPLGVAAALFVGALGPSFALWTLAGAHTWPRMILGGADRIDVALGVASIGFLVVPLVMWTAILTRPGALAFVSARIERVAEWAARRLPIAATLLARRSVPEISEDLRLRSVSVLRRNGLRIFVASCMAQVLLASILLASMHAVGAPANLDGMEVIRAFALVRVFSSFVPVPGGIGVMELGIVSALTTAGATRPEALAALAVYRGLTFFLPIVTGAIAGLVWRRNQAQ
jgi:putative heme transporter